MEFDWIPPGDPDLAPSIAAIKPTEILYDFNGPVLFSAETGGMLLLSYKTEEQSELNQFIAAPTSPAIIQQLKEGTLSLRTALVQPWIWILEADAAFIVKKSWATTGDAIPDELLPKPGKGIYFDHGVILEKQNVPNPAFLSIHFKGGALQRRTLPLGVFKSLVDDVYESIVKIFSPAIQSAAPDLTERMMRRALDVQLYEPAFSSLLIEIEQPKINLEHVLTNKNVDSKEVNVKLEEAGQSFFSSSETIAGAAVTDRLNASADNLTTLQIMSQIVPGSRSAFDTVELGGAASLERGKKLVIGATTGQKIRDVYSVASTGQKAIKGSIVEVSARSFTFIVRTELYREITCVGHTVPIQEAIPKLRNGMHVVVAGLFETRARRDRIRIYRLTVDGTTIVA